jgi:drug/metabolite transporter (DMT)-like permease
VSTLVFLAVLAAALMHAGWSALVKRDRDPVAMTLAISIMGLPVGLVGLLATGLPGMASVPFMVGSVAVHAAYSVTTALSYRHGDLTASYPVARGLAPALTALAAFGIGGEMLSPGGWAGIALVVSGALLVAVAGARRSADLLPGQRGSSLKGTGWAALAALTIASYTLLDGLGARASDNAAAYAFLLMALCSLSALTAFTAAFGPAVVTAARERWKPGLAGASVSTCAYTIALWAMTQAPIGQVAALRETSIAFAVLIGVVILGERPPPVRIVAAGVILAGAAVLRLA